jgi:chromosome condensin MukBEF ATPase and DNA-binding subunit MukB
MSVLDIVRKIEARAATKAAAQARTRAAELHALAEQVRQRAELEISALGHAAAELEALAARLEQPEPSAELQALAERLAAE